LIIEEKFQVLKSRYFVFFIYLVPDLLRV
jgi:hypothetical protein